MRNILCAALLAAALATPAWARDSVTLESAVFVERADRTDDGRPQRRIEPAGTLTRGDTVVLLVEWQAPRRTSGGFAVTSPIPNTLSLRRVSQDKGMEVSVDGGRHWGELGTLTIRETSGPRLASPQDVTHLRWRVSPGEAARGRGRMTYSATVR